MALRAMELFKAYAEEKLPTLGGYIVSSFFQETSAYSKYEIVAYNHVKALYLSGEGLTFQADGNKLFILAEPANYTKKHMEPFTRDSDYQISHRFSELEIITAKNQTRVMVSKAPVMTYSSFTILKPTGQNFAFIFYNLPDVLETIAGFFQKTLNAEAAVPKSDAAKAAGMIVAGLKKFTIWKEQAD
jgi:hypothetical protein